MLGKYRWLETVKEEAGNREDKGAEEALKVQASTNHRCILGAVRGNCIII